MGDIYKRLKEFRSNLPNPLPRLYFVKADVQSAFDTIPQEAVLKLMTAIPSQTNYKVFKHAEVRAGEKFLTGTVTAVHDDGDGTAAKPPPKPSRRWNWTAYPSDESRPFLQRLDGDNSSSSSSSSVAAAAARQRKNTVFVNSAAQTRHDTRGLLQLLAEHVTDNHIKVGKKMYRQRRGIPQGSVLSSYLCNYLYADLEAKHLGFLREDGGGGSGSGSGSVLLRLTDDFLLITTDRRKAQRFAAVLHRGVPEYGVQVNPKKSLANFAVSVAAAAAAPSGNGDGPQPQQQQQQQQPVQIATVDSGADFPYCGVLINCRTLEVRKDVRRDQQTGEFLAWFGLANGRYWCQVFQLTDNVSRRVQYLDG